MNNLNNLNRTESINSSTNNQAIEYSTIEKCANTLKERFDSRYGGFGDAPKFPSTQNILFLNIYYFENMNSKIANSETSSSKIHSSENKKLKIGNFENENSDIKEIITKTLDGTYNGGIFDHIGDGFSRYSVDQYWKVPHFEKMMYDNGMLIIAYIEAGILFDEKYLKIAERTLDYCFREMLENNGFYTAQDADSEGEEGKYYLFTPNEIKSVLGEEGGEKFSKIFDITKEGKFEGKNIPSLIRTYLTNKEEYNHLHNVQNIQNGKLSNDFFEKSFKKLYEYRLKRIPPFKDEKNLAFVNGLMIATLAISANILKKEEYINKACEIGDFILNSLTKNQRLYTSYKDGDLRNKGVLDDYAYVIWGLIELYQVTLDEKWLIATEDLTEKMIELFFENGIFYLSGKDVDDLPIRTKSIYDGAIPSGNNIAICNLIKLYNITNNDKYKEVYESALTNLMDDINRNPNAFPTLISGILNLKNGGLHVNLQMDSKDETTKKENIKIAKEKLKFWNPFLTISIDFINENKIDINTNSSINNENIDIKKEIKITVCENMTCRPSTNIDDFSMNDIKVIDIGDIN